MKKIIIISLSLVAAMATSVKAQDKPEAEKYGNTLNLGAGVGYYGYIGHPLPVGSLNFELDVARNFTLAPFVSGYTYTKNYYWGKPDEPKYDESYRYYSYRVVAIPVGLKGTYYFDQLMKANEKWDFYAAASAGFVFRSVTWDSDYYGDKRVYRASSPLFLAAHIGAEYHLNDKAGLFLDLSTGISTIGLAIHF
jgi:hypothetical protein